VIPKNVPSGAPHINYHHKQIIINLLNGKQKIMPKNNPFGKTYQNGSTFSKWKYQHSKGGL